MPDDAGTTGCTCDPLSMDDACPVHGSPPPPEHPTLRASLEEAEVRAPEILAAVKALCPEGWGVVLWLASYGESGFYTYQSTIERSGAVRMLRDWIASVEPGGPADAPGFVDRTADECICCGGKDDLMVISRPRRAAVLCRACLAVAKKLS